MIRSTLKPFILTISLLISQSALSQEKRPNIIFILADDFGYMDMQAYAYKTLGNPKEEMYYETPNLDRLVDEGVSFSQAYANQLCSPTRASILTGKYAARVGFTTATPARDTYYNQNKETPEGYYPNDVLYHGDDIKIEQSWINGVSNTGLPAGTKYDNGQDEVTIAEALEDYHSAFIGKWHVGGHGAKGYQPQDQGFEPIAWFDAGGSPYFDWRKVWNNKKKERFPKIPQKEWTVGDAGTATNFDYLTDDLTQQALNFIDQRSNGDKPFFLYFNHFAIHTPLQGKEEWIDYFDKKETKGWNGHNDPVYASMIKSLDESVGRILEKLKSNGLEENTVIIFMSDNGGIDQGVAHNHIGTKNTPFVGGKACLTEGGIRVPLVFRWKGKIQEGLWSDIPVDCSDLFPTLLELGGYNADTRIEELELDGRSIAGLLKDPDNSTQSYTKDTHYWHYPFNVIYKNPLDGLALTPHSAVREGDYKLIFDWYGRLRLYDIEKDPFEENNLVDVYPVKTDLLMKKLMSWLSKEVDKRYWPKLNPNYDAAKESRETKFENLITKYLSEE